jgi:hypothetical protein
LQPKLADARITSSRHSAPPEEEIDEAIDVIDLPSPL